ncbi:hypothetical protein D3C81_2096990 [compost metagenome]
MGKKDLNLPLVDHLVAVPEAVVPHVLSKTVEDSEVQLVGNLWPLDLIHAGTSSQAGVRLQNSFDG